MQRKNVHFIVTVLSPHNSIHTKTTFKFAKKVKPVCLSIGICGLSEFYEVGREKSTHPQHPDR